LREIVEQPDAWIERGDKVALATIVAVRRSAPRPPGSKLAIDERVVQTARQVPADGRRRRLTRCRGGAPGG
jgi:xanthine/CO dehydrogenase XdhC/CoxF family maturation factor